MSDKPKLELGVNGYINPGHIVNVFFTSSQPIFRAEVLQRAERAGEYWHLKTEKGIIWVQAFERMDLVGSVA